MKVGILTAFYAPNYGAVLQCYALQNTLESEGSVECEVVNYIPASLDVHWSIFPYHQLSLSKPIKENAVIVAKAILFFTFRYSRKKKFERFVKNCLKVSSEKYDENNATFGKNYDLFVIGSDQMWSKNLFEMNEVYWGNFQRPSSSYVSTYAVSAGSIDQFSAEDVKYIEQSLKNFSKIGVREDVLNDFISAHTTLKVETVLDPTLLLPKSRYDEMAVKPKEENYILIYRIGDNDLVDEVAEIAAKYYGSTIVEVGNSMITHRMRHKNYVHKLPTVEEFLGYFKYANCVLSKSFHGLVFSLVFEKQFYVFESEIMDRVNRLLDIVELKDRVVTRDSVSSVSFSGIDYDKVNLALSRHRESSLSYIQEMLQVKSHE